MPPGHNDWLQSGTSGSRLSLSTGVLFHDTPAPITTRFDGSLRDTRTDSDYVAASLAWSATDLHESGHWVRSHGTTLGVLLLVLRGGFDHTATDMLGEPTLRSAHESVTTRLTDPASWEAASMPDDLAPWSESLAALDLGYRMILDGSRVVRDIPFDALSMLNVAVSDAWFHWSQLGFTSDHDGSTIRSINGPVAWMFDGPTELTTRMLLECASIIDEGALTGLANILAPDVAQMHLQSMLGVNGSPIYWASLLAKRSPSIHELMALIDFSLNPPLSCLDGDRRTTEWAEFYPPHRFVLAAQTLATGALECAEVCTGQSLATSLADLAARTGLRLGTYGFPRAATDLETAFGKVGNHYGVLFDVAQQLHAVRASHPEAIAHFGWAVSSRESELSIPVLEDRLSDSPSLSATLDAPFVCRDGRYLASRTGQLISTPYIVSAAMYSGVRDIINRTAPDTTHLPASLLMEPSFTTRVDELIAEATGWGDWLAFR